MPASIDAVLVSNGWKIGTLQPVTPLKPTVPMPGMQPGGAATTVSGPALRNVWRISSSLLQPWQPARPRTNRSSRSPYSL